MHSLVSYPPREAFVVADVENSAIIDEVMGTIKFLAKKFSATIHIQGTCTCILIIVICMWLLSCYLIVLFCNC